VAPGCRWEALHRFRASHKLAYTQGPGIMASQNFGDQNPGPAGAGAALQCGQLQPPDHRLVLPDGPHRQPRNARGFAYWSRLEDWVGRDGIFVGINDCSDEVNSYTRFFTRIEPLGKFPRRPGRGPRRQVSPLSLRPSGYSFPLPVILPRQLTVRHHRPWTGEASDRPG
jgi:hypothetical protein